MHASACTYNMLAVCLAYELSKEFLVLIILLGTLIELIWELWSGNVLVLYNDFFLPSSFIKNFLFLLLAICYNMYLTIALVDASWLIWLA